MGQNERGEEVHHRILKFQESRRNDTTKKSARKIIERLEEERQQDAEIESESDVGWVRLQTLIDEFVGKEKLIKNQTTLFRLINDLYREKLIDKIVFTNTKLRGRQATFYRTPSEYRQEWLLDRRQLEELCGERMICINGLIEQFQIAQQLLTEKGYQNPYSAIKEIYVQRHQTEPSYKVCIDLDLLQNCTDKNGHIDPAKIIETIRKERSGFKNST